MSVPQKPENALKRAEELIEVGKKQDALDTLHAAIQHRKVRNLWTSTIEKIMVKHLELCVELKKMRTAREGLYQYRTMCQAANISSLELVVQRFRKAAEEKVSEAKKAQDLHMKEMGDLDEMESPQTILLRAIQANDTRQQSQDRDVHMHFRFLWDTYKVVLDVLKSNIRLEEVYHETARHAFEFCRANQRPQEFKRLCDTLRKNFQELNKHPSGGGKTAVHQVNPNNAETIMRTLETRCKQLQISTELDLWGGAYLTATEIFDLMSKARPKPHLRSMYYEYLGQIFWKSDNHLFHAFACLKNLMFVKAAKQNITKDELQLLASKAVLATLCVPFQKTSDIHATLELTTEGASSPYEKAKKHAQLFNVQTVPTRDSIAQSLVDKGLLALAAEPCKKLFALIESDFTPLSLCQDAKPFLDDIATGELFDGKLVPYVTPLKQIIFFRLMKQLSEVYANMTIDNFEHAASIVPFSIAEKWMANAARQHGINIQINYSHKAIVFGAPRKVDMKSMRQPLIEIGLKLQQAMQRVAPDEQNTKEKLEKQQLSTNIVKRIEEETKLIRQRKEEIERRKEESERRKDLMERKAQARQREQEEREAEAERARQEIEREKREREREEQRKREQEMIKNKEMLEEMKKQADLSKASNLKIQGKKIQEIAAEDLTKLDPLQIMRAREEQMKRDRQEKIRQRKLESKRVDHLARALREEERHYLDQWAEEVEAEDAAYLDKAEAKMIDEQRNKHAELLKERDVLVDYSAAKDSWYNQRMEARRDEYEELYEARRKRCEEKVVANKIERARERLAAGKAADAEREKADKAERDRRRREQEDEERREQEAREEEERKEEEEREKERAAEEKKQKLEAARKRKEEEEEARKRQDEKRRQREEEIEARQKAEAEAGKSVRAPDRGAERDREREREPPRRTEGDDWRSRPKAEERTPRRGGDDRDRDRDPPARGGGGGGGWRDRDEAPRERRDDDRDRDRDAPARGGGGTGGGWRDRDEPPRERREDDRRRDEDRRRDDDRPVRRGDDDRPVRRGDDDRPARRSDDREGWRNRGRDEEADGDDSWRRPAAPAPAKAEEKDAWRSSATRDPPARAGERNRDREEEDKGGSAWGRPRPGAGGSGSAWGKPDREEGGAWRGGRREEGGDKDEGSSWRKGKEDDKDEGVAGRRSKEEEPPARAPREAPAPKKEEPEPAADEEDDDGFTSVVKGKKKKPKAETAEERPSAWARGAPGASGGSERRQTTPPWKRGK